MNCAAKLELQNASQSRYSCTRNFKLQIKIYIISLEWLDCEARFGSATLNFSQVKIYVAVLNLRLILPGESEVALSR